MRDPPARDSRRWRVQRVGPAADRSPQQHGDRAAALCRELQPACLSHVYAADLADHRPQPTMTQPVLYEREEFGIIAGLRIDYPRGIQTCLEQPRSEQIAGAYHPQHGAGRARGNAGNEQDCGCVIAPARIA